ncbi:hypothetical protein FRC10_001051 [Ceratobasidium sp. 414]|nr:hypothetical protein FRC10_001051 [Ceratobasidium sp. 414]
MPQSIFDIPELVQSVNVYLKPRDSVRLSLSNLQLFFTTMPLLWERVGGLVQLLKLIPALGEINYRGKKQIYKPSQQPLVEADFSRFNLYGPWIKHLEIRNLPPYSREDVMLNALYPFAITHALLPNLTSISYGGRGTIDIFWVLPFLSPSLLSLELAMVHGQTYYRIPIPHLAILGPVLSKRCTNLKTLLLPRPNEPIPGYPRELSFLGGLKKGIGMEGPGEPPSSFGLVMASFPPLVSLTICDEIFDHSGFEAISTWPLLKYLGIYLEPNKVYGLPKLSGMAFPSLKHFALYGCQISYVSMFWNVPMLVSRLTSVKLELLSDFFLDGDDFSPLFISILTALTEQSSHMQELWLRITDYCDQRIGMAYPVSISTLGILRSTLRTLYIDGVCFPECPNIVEPLSEMFPSIRELRFPGYQVDFFSLEAFRSKMPRLEILYIDLGLQNLYWHCPLPEVDLCNIPRHRRSLLHTLELNFSGLIEDLRSPLSRLSYTDIVSLAE